jgi:tRNA A-37 threonylcarbamoyl transferase component Bud32
VERNSRSIGPYEIRGQIGAGGMGVVYEAWDPRLNRRVALKTLRAQLLNDEDARRRFLAEARAIAAVSHPNVIEIFDIREEQGAIYFAMEFLEGRCVETLLREQNRLPVDRALDIVRQAAAGLRAAAAHGTIHRDVKPANLLLTADGRVKVTDFGLAKQTSADVDQTSSTVFFGTPGYLSPERAAGQTVDERSDIYSLGATLYELLTGQPPFRGPNALAVITQHLREPVPPPSKWRPDLPYPVQLLVLRMLAKVPENRPQNYGVLISQVERLLRTGKSPAQARPAAEEAPRGPESWAGAMVGGFAVLVMVVLAWAMFRPEAQPPTAAPPAHAASPARPAETTPPPASPAATTPAPVVPETARKADLVVVRNVSEINDEGHLRVVGEVKNVGEGNAVHSRAKVSLLDTEGEEVGSVEVPLTPQDLRPKDIAAFEATLDVDAQDAVIKIELSWVS